MTPRELPHNKHAERAVISTILYNDNVDFGLIRSMLEPDDFLSLPNKTIFESMIRLHKDGLPYDDIVVLGQDIMDRDLKNAVGDYTYFSELSEDAGSSVRAEYYARIVLDMSRKRQLMAASDALYDAGKSNISVDDFLNETRQQIEEVNKRGEIENEGNMEDILSSAYNSFENKDGARGVVKTGIGALDSKTGGLWPGLLTVLAARPSMGKSCLAINIAANAGLAGKRVLFFSLEDTAQMIIYRMIARFSNLNLDLLIRQSLTSRERDVIESKRELLGCMDIKIIDRPLSSDQICNLSRAETKTPDLVIVDHLGHVTDKGDLYEATTNAARTFAQLPKDLNCPVLLLHQLNRANVNRTEKEPILTDLRQSGEVEQLARVVWMLHRQHYYDKKGDRNLAQLFVRKNSHGSLGTISMYADLAHMLFRDYDQQVEQDY